MLRPTYPLRTERLLLRPFDDDDLDAVYETHSRGDITRYLYWEPRTRDEAREMVERRKLETAIEAEGDGLHLVAQLHDSPAMVGHVSLQWVSQEHRQGEIGFVLHPDHHGRGYATEASAAVLRLGFEGLDLHRIVGRCDGRNIASARVMERLGMRREAHLRENEFIKGEWTDELVYAILADDWRTAGSGSESGGTAG
jgi:RimJ/RimL family protein N-acetyltransferase